MDVREVSDPNGSTTVPVVQYPGDHSLNPSFQGIGDVALRGVGAGTTLHCTRTTV